MRAETIPNLKGVAPLASTRRRHAAVGFGDGKVKLLKFADLSEIGEIAAPAPREPTEARPDAPACAVKFSPDGQSIGRVRRAVTLYEAAARTARRARQRAPP